MLSRVRRWIRPPAPQPVILMYHRVARSSVDPWGLAVQPDRFGQHIDVLLRNRHPLPLSEFVARLERGTLRGDAVAVTFDDGYADNLVEARPRLAARGIAATVFVTTGALGQATDFWWDELARGILLREEPVDCELDIAGERCRLAFARSDDAAHERRWRAWEESRTEREATYLRVWERLRLAPAPDRTAAMDLLRRALSIPAPEASALPMAPDDLIELAGDRLIEIGGHTVTHAPLPALDDAQRRHEVVEGRRTCEELLGRPIEGFAYPHGAHDPESRAVVEASGFAWACSTGSRAVPRRGYDLYALPRIPVADWDGDQFERALVSTWQ